MSFGLFACQESIDASDAYTKANEQMDSLSAYMIEATINIEAKSSDETVSLPSSLTYIIKDKGTEKEESYLMITDDISGTDIKIWSAEGMSFIEDGDTRYRKEGIISAFDLDLNGVITEENISAKRQDDTVTVNISAVDVKDIMDQFLDLGNNVYKDLVLADTADITVNINADGYISDIYFITAADIEGVGNVEVEMIIRYSAYDEVTVPEYDKEGFIDPDTANDSVYADSDLTADNIAVLESSGYTLQDDGTYYNGTYHVDLEYRQLYTDTVVYDWEYDQGYIVDDAYNIVCTYNFIDDTSEGECDKETISALKTAYDELVSKIEPEQ